MKRVHSFKKLTRDGRSNSPQGRLSIGSTGPVNLDVSYSTRPRSSSNSSFHALPSEGKLSFADDHAANNSNENRSSTPAGYLLTEPLVQPVNAPVAMSGVENGGGNQGLASYDVVDGSPAAEQQRNRVSAELDHLQQKILKISEAIKLEQGIRDSNVADYLKLAHNADKQQTSRIKTVFEKKNQKSNATISQLQKKLDTYHRRFKELESNGGGRQSRLRELSGGVVDSVKQVKQATQSAAGAIVSKPKDFFRNKFGSADNLSSLHYDDADDYTTRYGSADDVSSASESLEFGGTSMGPDEMAQRQNSLHSGPDSPTNGVRAKAQISELTTQLMNLQSEIEELHRTRSQFESDFDMFKNQAHNEITFLTDTLREERNRYERLEVQLNDLTELHQHEVSSLKQDLTSMEDKVEYHARERARDMQEAIENCQTRLARMELQQQQMVAVEGLENANARALLGKAINLLLSVLAVILVFVSTISGLITPLMRSPARIMATLVAVFATVVTYRHYDKLVNWYMQEER